MLYVSQHQGLVRLGHQDAGGAVVGIPGAGGRGVRSLMVKMSGTKV
jgi:hypothetical protein